MWYPDIAEVLYSVTIYILQKEINLIEITCMQVTCVKDHTRSKEVFYIAVLFWES